MKRKKIAIIGTAGVPARYGGFETLAQQLVDHMNEEYDIHVYNSTKIYPKYERYKSWNGARIHYVPLNANGWQSIVYDIISIIHALFYADFLLILGVSGGIALPFVRLFSKKKIIVNIDGLEWRRNKWNKLIKKFLKFSEFLAVKYSHADIADNLGIKKYSALAYQTLSHLIEYGADHVEHDQLEKATLKKYPFLSMPYACAVARIEPENNIHITLEAFSMLKGKNLVFIGNWNNSEYGKNLREKYSKFEHMHLLDPIYDQKILDSIRSNCLVYIHGHSAGGTNPSLVEAMYLKLPVIAFDVSYNVTTTENQAMYFKNPDELTQLIRQTTIPKYAELSKKMKEIADSRYLWKIIVAKYSGIIKGFAYNYTKSASISMFGNAKTSWLVKQGLGHFKHSRMFFE